jgi:hypothetical protein
MIINIPTKLAVFFITPDLNPPIAPSAKAIKITISVTFIIYPPNNIIYYYIKKRKKKRCI